MPPATEHTRGHLRSERSSTENFSVDLDSEHTYPAAETFEFF